MKKVIKNAVYNTDTAKQLGSMDNGYPINDFHYFEETLYRTQSGKYFLYGHGGALSRYGEWHGNSGRSSEKIMPMSYEDASEWAQENLDGDEYIEIFGDPEGGDKAQLNVTISKNARNKLDELRDASNLTLSTIIERLIENGESITFEKCAKKAECAREFPLIKEGD